jgi:hypothetical protein
MPSEARTKYVVPESLRHVSLARRPGFGKEGQKCTVRTNFYQAKCSKDFVYQHDVSLPPPPSNASLQNQCFGPGMSLMKP